MRTRMSARTLVLFGLCGVGCAAQTSAPTVDIAVPEDLSHTARHDMATGEIADMTATVLPDLAAPSPHALFVAVPDLVGFITTLNGSSSTDPRGRALSYGWKLTAAPSCSHLGDDPFSAMPEATPSPSPTPVGPSSAHTAFLPDCGGTYSVTLTVTTADGSSGSVTQPVVVPTAPLFLYSGHADYNNASTEIDVIRSDGTGLHPVSCPVVLPFGFSSARYGQSNEPFANLTTLGSIGLRAWQPAAGTKGAARVAFVEQLPVGDSSTLATYKLSVSDENGDCASAPPVRVEDATGFTNVPKVWPRYSPSGNRLAFMDAEHWSTSGTQQWRLETVNLDGSQRRIVRTQTTDTAPRAAPVWLDETHLAWVESSGDFVDNIIYQAPDTVGAGDGGATRTVLLDCSVLAADGKSPTMSEITQFAQIPTGLVVAGTAYATSGVGLYKMGATCLIDIPLLSNTHDGVGDFDLSSDQRTVLVATTFGSDAGGSARDIYTVSTSGADATQKRIAGDPRYDDFGPHYIAGGRQIVWTQLTSNLPDASVKGAGIMVANADGSYPRALAGENAQPASTDQVVGGSNGGWSGCKTSGSAATQEALPLVLLLLFAFVLRLRRQRAAP